MHNRRVHTSVLRSESFQSAVAQGRRHHAQAPNTKYENDDERSAAGKNTFFDFLPASALQSGEFLLQKTFYSKRLPTPKGQSHDAQSPTDAAGKVWPPSFFPSSLLAPTLRAIPSSIGVILTCSRARPSSAPSTCPRPQAFRARPALSFTRPQQVCPAFFAHPLASSSAALGRDEERSKQLRWLSYVHGRLIAAHFPTPTTDCSQPCKYLHPPLHFQLLPLS